MRKEYKSIQPGYKIIITYPEKKEGNFSVRGYPVDKNYIRVDNSKIVRKEVKYIEELETKKAFVKNIVEDQLDELLRKKNNSTQNKNVRIETELSKTFNEVLDTGGDYWPWQEGYANQIVAYSRKNIIPWIQENIKENDNFTAVEKLDLQRYLAENRMKHGNFKKNNHYEDALAGVANYMNAFDQIYKVLMSFNSNLKDWNFAIGNRTTPMKHEQIKMLPPKVHKAFRKLVEADIKSKPKYARGAALMDNNLRAGEASAWSKEWMIDMSDFIVVWVLWQEEKGGKTDRLKSEGSYRPVIMDEWGTMVVKKCNELIDDIDETPIPDSQLSAYVRELLYKSGLDDIDFQVALNDLLKHLEYNSAGKPIIDVSAHLLRRNRTSIQCNYCNYSSTERDLYSGHKTKVNRYKYSDPKSGETHRMIAIKNSLYDLNPEISNNPKHKPIDLINVEGGKIFPFPIYRFINSSDKTMILKLNISTTEMGESVSIISSSNVIVKIKSQSKDNNGKRKNENLIGVIKDEEENN